MNYKPFDKLDWDGFAGAEPFTDGSEPLIAEGKFLDAPFTDYLFIADGNGFFVSLMRGTDAGETYEQEDWQLDKPNTEPPVNKLLYLPSEWSYELLNELGFEKL